VRKIFYWLLVGLFLTGKAAADIETPRITANLNHSRVTIGDRITLTLEVDAPEGSQVIFPELKDHVGDLEVKGVQKTPNHMEAILTSYSVGSFAIPILSTQVIAPNGEKTTLETLQLFVEVVSVAKKGDPMVDIRDIKGPMVLPGFFLSPWRIVGILLLGGLFVLFYFLRKRTSPKPNAPPLPPHLVALEALDKLDRELLFDHDVKEYHFLVSGILRRYLEDRFGVRAPEQTTEEFLKASSKNHILNDPQKVLLKSFLEQCDLVKFAKLTPSAQEARRISQIARGFINEAETYGAKRS